MRKEFIITAFAVLSFLKVGITQPIMSVEPDSFDVTISVCNDTVTLPLTVYNTGSTNLNWNASVEINKIEDDFDPGIDNSIWSFVSDIASSSCGSFNGANALYFNATGIREAATNDIDVSNGGTIEFYLKIGTGFAPCESADGGEEVYLQYSTNGGAGWTTIQMYNVFAYPNFTFVQENIPVAAQTGSTRFRWVQPNNSGFGYDNWAIDDISINIIDALCTLSSNSGVVIPTDSAVINVGFNANGLISGVYATEIIITSNDPLNSVDTIPCTITVLGYPVVELSATSLNFDTIMQWTTATDTLFVYNTGCDTLFISNITKSSSDFTVDSYVSYVLREDTGMAIISFTPATVGAFYDTLHIYNNDTDTIVLLQGISYGHPAISVNPDTFNVTVSNCRDSVTLPLTIYNIGDTNLIWSASVYEGAQQNLTDNFDPIDNSVWSFVSDIPSLNCGSFSGVNALYFNFTGIRQAATKDINVSNGGTIDFYLKIGTGVAPCESADGGEEVYLQYSTNGGAGWTTIQTYDVFAYPNFTFVQENIPVAAQTKSTRFRWVQPNNSGAGFDNWAIDDILIDAITDICIIDTGSGITTSTDSTVVNVKFNTNGLNKGVYTSEIIITSNDPLNPSDTIPCTLTVLGYPVIELSATGLNFDTIMQWTTATDTLLIYNTGCDTLFISNITKSSSNFAVDNYVPYVLREDTGMAIISFTPATVGVFYDTLHIYNNDTDTIILLQGTSYGAPVVSVNPDTFNITVTSCVDSVTLPLTIYNNGDTDLIWNINTYVGQILTDDFAPDIDNAVWIVNNGIASSNCGSNSDSNALYFDYGGAREADTRDMNVSNGGTIDFYLKIATGAYPCEAADGGEEVYLQYSTNGGAGWTTIQVYNVFAYPNFTFVQENIPVAAQTNSTRFRWIQPNNSGAGYDNWAIDDISISIYNNICSLNPDSGVLVSDDSTTIYVKFDGTTSPPGIYTGQITINSKDPLNPVLIIPITFNKKDYPVPPTASDMTVCLGEPVPDLTATGSNVNWYIDPTLTILVHSGNNFPTGNTAMGIHTYYVTQTIDDCEGISDTVTLSIYPVPSSPVSSDVSVCYRQSVPDMTATGSIIKWYDDAALTNLVYTGNNFSTGHTSVGTYTYYVTQTNAISGCESADITATLSILPLPAAPIAADTAICFGQPTPEIVATGNNIQWYSDSGLTTLMHTGDTLVTGETAVGVYNYYVTSTDTITSCVSPVTVVTLFIDTGMATKPSADDITICFGYPIPDLTAAGSNIKWYSDTALTILVHTGNTYATGHTAVGTYTYYVTQTNGCGSTSVADTAVLTILSSPATLVGNDTTICFGNPTPDLIADGNLVKWYADLTLTTLLHNGDTFATGETTVGTYTYYVTQTDTINGCESVPDTVILSIIVCADVNKTDNIIHNITIYPNPTTGSFTVDITSNMNEIMVINISNSVGQIVLSQRAETINGSSQQTFDIKHLSQGMYYIQIVTRNEVFIRKLVLKY